MRRTVFIRTLLYALPFAELRMVALAAAGHHGRLFLPLDYRGPCVPIVADASTPQFLPITNDTIVVRQEEGWDCSLMV